MPKFMQGLSCPKSPAKLARSRRRERNTVAWHEKEKGRAFFVRIRIILNALRSGLSQAGSECRSASSAGKEMDVALHMHWQAREEEEEGRIALDALWVEEGGRVLMLMRSDDDRCIDAGGVADTTITHSLTRALSEQQLRRRVCNLTQFTNTTHILRQIRQTRAIPKTREERTIKHSSGLDPASLLLGHS